MIKDEIKNLIASRAARVGVIGLGYVGLPLLVEFAAKGFRAVGFEVDERKADTINRGETYIVAAAMEIQERLRRGQLVILESTTYPGTTDEVLLPMFEEADLKLDRDFLLAFSPERVDPGNPQFKTDNIPKVVGGCTDDSTEVAAALYGQIVKDVHPVTSARVAEAAKLLENTFRAVNIGMANEMARLCYHLGIDTWEVIRAAATKPFGFMPFYPGPGIGGHCIPLDPHYLSWKARQHGFD